MAKTVKNRKPHAQPKELLEISVATALELQRLNLAALLDIRQKFELEIQGEIPEASFLPLFHFKKILGHTLTPMEQAALDEDVPELRDIQHFLSMINNMHHSRELVLVCVCNSGHRSLSAARLLRLLGYPNSFSLAGGFQALEELREKENLQDHSREMIAPAPPKRATRAVRSVAKKTITRRKRAKL
jgi:rhodanese-related sulfurtransferase